MRMYLMIGMIFYVIMSVAYYKSFERASLFEVFKGLVWGILCWPAALTLHLYRVTR